jgi:vesicle coat complex subunit
MMTIGRDVSTLFHDVVRCLESTELDIKKLVYLYVINTSKISPADAMMVINNLRKDATHKTNPIIRALAIRTMGYMRV